MTTNPNGMGAQQNTGINPVAAGVAMDQTQDDDLRPDLRPESEQDREQDMREDNAAGNPHKATISHNASEADPDDIVIAQAPNVTNPDASDQFRAAEQPTDRVERSQGYAAPAAGEELELAGQHKCGCHDEKHVCTCGRHNQAGDANPGPDDREVGAVDEPGVANPGPSDRQL